MKIKNQILLGFILVILIVCSSCNNQTYKSDIKFLTNNEYWYFFDEVTGEYEKIKFSDDFSFYWGCACGEPIGDSDLYELFEYDEKTKIIKLYNEYDDSTKNIEIINYTPYNLLLKIDGKIKGYTSEIINPSLENPEKYLKSYNIIGTTIEGNSEEVKIGPTDYDGDVNYPENVFNYYKLTDDVEFYNLEVEKIITNGKEKIEETYEELSVEDGIKNLNSNYGFIWLNENLKIEKIVFYGEIINER